MFPEKPTDTEQPRKAIYEVIDNDYFEQSDVKLPKEWPLKFKKQSNETQVIPVKVKTNKHVGLFIYFKHIVKVKRSIIAESDTNPEFKSEGQ